MLQRNFLLRGLEPTRRFLRRLYYSGFKRCAACGCRSRLVRQRVLPDELVSQWNISPNIAERIDAREGLSCALCGCNWRGRHLARTILEELARSHGVRAGSIASVVRRPALKHLQVAEINEVAGLHRYLSGLAGLAYSEFGSDDPAIRHEDLASLTYADQSFDYVLTSDTLEHVPDFDRALAEIRRILKPRGTHIFTIPVVWDRLTRQRAQVTPAGLRHLLPPSYHGSATEDRPDYLVFNEFGKDVVERIARAGFSVRVEHDPDNAVVSTFVTRRI